MELAQSQYCQIGVYPQQIKKQIGQLVFDSSFDSGNLMNVEQVAEDHTKLFKNGMKPVYRAESQSLWQRIKDPSIADSVVQLETGIEITFNHEFNGEKTYFAFCHPYSYSKLQEDLDYYQTKYEDDKDIYFHRNTFTYSYEKRKIDLIVISSHTQKCEERISRIPLLFPEQSEQTPFMFEKEKKCIFFSTRVHPGETPGQHNFNGALQFLLNKNDPVAQIARENFVFYLVPMINPDGVYRGHYRVDALGQNLNRFYLKPQLQEQPQIYAIRELISYLNDTQRIHGYIDFHSQASRKGNFIYANHTDFRNQIDICLFCRVLSLNTPYFEYDQCNFTEKNMYSKDKSDNLSKEGSGRVALFKQFKINLTFTVESSYNQGNIENKMYPRSNMLQQTEQQQNDDIEIYDAQLIYNPLELQPYQINEHFTIEQQNKLGEGVVETFLDMCEMNPFSRIKNSPYKSFINAKLKMAFNLMKVPPFRFDLYIRKLMRYLKYSFESYNNIFLILDLLLETLIQARQ
ncbi:hypothetical protein PPERSA_11972 [Pseudocohnilembus persalinus]|uniref:tubulin-glutamate carboxypeptidase n=1 Tax=Pseudocohnilembus persalinus TaxID=266149 RepID=A0A0V0QKK4_PSEPJ|nr:hypothetical protein PPERSA_11972 [Pseudocohnilembus persalinus]|eukprot:KRX02632.1 hypothetical protein PPERSA_11972 [Pseudocohnilembus persalinus]